MKKGQFEFVESTIVYIFESGKINIYDIILKNTRKEVETIIKLGQKNRK